MNYVIEILEESRQTYSDLVNDKSITTLPVYIDKLAQITIALEILKKSK